jgi:hypothetical protein
MDDPSTARHSQLAAGLSVVAGVLVALSALLPFTDTSGVDIPLSGNHLVNHGAYGWVLLVAGVGIACSPFSRTWTKRQSRGDLGVLIGIAAVCLAVDALTPSLRTATGINSLGNYFDQRLPFGPAIYVGGVGTVLAFVALTSRPHTTTLRCPDCAEEIMAADLICKHCGCHIYAQTSVRP